MPEPQSQPMTNNEFLISESTLNVKMEDLRHLVKAVKGEYAVDTEDEIYGTAFRYYLLFALWPTLLHGNEPALTPQTCFYNKYHWFLRFKHLYTLKHGFDAGLEQQAFKILEGVDFDLDWSVVEQIESGAGNGN